ncbi:efflux RND transporter periplasmic adaptor subunit [Rheinheimera mangrovi]|uniref:efflux RND transporter periplasmic adaptor subunit n=1 Tax=Rheinheimera mangrovi TaxID=2498451 RepID=UPI0013DFBE52|nr:HlyD family efflux transporter periplasmic adaptor subunit [Rheinheimera mangrovi]
MHRYILLKSKPSFRRRALIAVLVGALLCLLLISIGLLSGPGSAVRQRLASPGTVWSEQRQQAVFGTGKIVSLQQQLIAAPESSLIESVTASQGQFIEAGAPLFVLKNLALLREQKEAELAVAEASSDAALRKSELNTQQLQLEMATAKAESEYQRQLLELSANEQLKNSGVLPAVKYEQYRLMAEQARFEAENLRKQIQLFRQSVTEQSAAMATKLHVVKERANYLAERLAALTIYAPAAGVIKSLSAHVGQSVSQGQVLLELVKSSPLYAEVMVPQYSATALAAGDTAVIKTPAGEFPGVVEFIDPIVREGAIQVRLRLTAQSDSLNLDQSVEAQIQSSRTTSVAAVQAPDDFELFDKWWVYQYQQGQLVKSQITVHQSAKGHLELTPSLSAGEQVVLIPAQQAEQDVYHL